MSAAKSFVQELTNGLLARGYLIEQDRRFHLGPGPFILAARANKLAALSVNLEFVVELSKVLGCTVLVGVRVGDSIVFTDFVGEEWVSCPGEGCTVRVKVAPDVALSR